MKRFVALLLSLCLMTASCAFAAQDYTVAEKLMKQLWAGSGFSGTLTVEMAAQDGKQGLETLKPIVVDADYIYVRGEKASWVNGGLLYKIDATGKYLTKEQIRNIATSL